MLLSDERLQKIRLRLKGQRVYFDTNPLIYFVEGLAEYQAVVLPVFEMLGKGELSAQTSPLTLTETTLKPLRTGHAALVAAYHDLLLDPDVFTLTQMTPQTFMQAAQIAAELNLKTPDALHMACAVQSECNTFLTNDLKIKPYAGVQVVYVSDP